MIAAFALGIVFGGIVVAWGATAETESDLVLRLAYAVLYDREFFRIGAKELRDGKFAKENVAMVNEMIAEDYDKWLTGELRPYVRRYFKAMPSRCDTWKQYPDLTGCP
jgi:hypothetical protein